jgi:hypothetical protein
MNTELSDLRRAEIICWCRTFKAEADAYTWRSVAVLLAVAWVVFMAWPWLMGFWEIARIWMGAK